MKFNLVRIEFDDHSHAIGGEAEVIPCVCWGVLYNETKKAYFVSSWMSDGKLNGENSDTYCILKGCVTKFSKIRVEDL